MACDLTRVWTKLMIIYFSHVGFHAWHWYIFPVRLLVMNLISKDNVPENSADVYIITFVANWHIFLFPFPLSPGVSRIGYLESHFSSSNVPNKNVTNTAHIQLCGRGKAPGGFTNPSQISALASSPVNCYILDQLLANYPNVPNAQYL